MVALSVSLSLSLPLSPSVSNKELLPDGWQQESRNIGVSFALGNVTKL